MEIKENICPHCNKHIISNIKVFANHVRWCKENPKYEEIRQSTLLKTKQKFENDKQEHLKIFKVSCSVCGKEIEVCEDDRKFPKREKYFCSRICSNTRIRTDEIKKKISNTLKEKYSKPHYCKYCGKEFFGRRKYCSDTCLKLSKTKNSKNQQLKVYLSYCGFNFSLNEFPNEFDFEAIKKYGWYKAKNHGNNLNGISRDHKFSRMMGWELKIDPYIISHPANCELLQHQNNISKHKKCSISLHNLILNINSWNERYGFYENKIDYKVFEDLGIEFSILYNENKNNTP